MFGRPPFKPSRQAQTIAAKLAAMPLLDDVEVFGPTVITIFTGAGKSAFWEIDEHEGYWDGLDNRFYMVRQVRNNPDWSKRLFAALAAPRPRPA